MSAVEAEATSRLIEELRDGADRQRLSVVLKEPELALIFPSLGMPVQQGIEVLHAACAAPGPGARDPTDDWIGSYVRALREVKDPLDQLLTELRDRKLDVLVSAFQRTREYLPVGCEIGSPRLVMLPLGYDSRTDGETIYMDPVASVRLGVDGMIHALSHELHHVARYRLTGENLTLMHPGDQAKPGSAHELLLQWIKWLEAEGVADCASNMIDENIAELAAAREARRQQMVDYARLLAGMIDTIRDSGSSAGGRNLEEIAAESRGIAHPVGARMGERIEREFGRSALVDCVGRPGMFLRRFEAVARSDDGSEIDWAYLRSVGGS
jgi:hypothetical protein